LGQQGRELLQEQALTMRWLWPKRSPVRSHSGAPDWHDNISAGCTRHFAIAAPKRRLESDWVTPCHHILL